MSKSRRKFLASITGGIAAIGAFLALIPFFKSQNIPKYRQRQRPYIDINISKIKPGVTKIVEFKGKPFLLRGEVKSKLKN